MKCAWLLLMLVLTACNERAAPGLVQRAQFGIFFGGQVQEREQIPFEASRAAQIQGFRLEFRAPLDHDLAIEWEINRPRASQKRERRTAGAGERLVQLAQARARAGQTRFDQVLAFKPGDPLGVWNIRVLAGGQLVIDRRFLVYDKEERARAERDAGAVPGAP
jgi:hypothetical protein